MRMWVTDKKCNLYYFAFVCVFNLLILYLLLIFVYFFSGLSNEVKSNVQKGQLLENFGESGKIAKYIVVAYQSLYLFINLQRGTCWSGGLDKCLNKTGWGSVHLCDLSGESVSSQSIFLLSFSLFVFLQVTGNRWGWIVWIYSIFKFVSFD